MIARDFVLDHHLAADTLPVTSLPMCDVRLMNDSRFTWLILVPRRMGLSEILDLSEHDQATLWREVSQAASALRLTVPCDKINIGALGNIVRQLHVHVVARTVGDTAWPGPVWGYGNATAYDPSVREALIHQLANGLPAQDAVRS